MTALYCSHMSAGFEARHSARKIHVVTAGR
jgi:hypothetical protein